MADQGGQRFIISKKVAAVTAELYYLMPHDFKALGQNYFFKNSA
jgi:hypothetical protein